MVTLLRPRGPASGFLLDALASPPPLPAPPPRPRGHQDLQLSLHLCYELHYRGLVGVDDRWEWEPSLLGFRQGLEEDFLHRLHSQVGEAPLVAPTGMAAVEAELQELASEPGDRSTSLSHFMQREATAAQFREFLIHRSIYHLKEADPHSWAIPRLNGAAKAALLEIQADEYGGGSAARMHSALFARSMRALGLDDDYGAYLNRVPDTTLATVNLMSLLGLHRRHRAAIAGHLALFEMTSSVPNGRYAQGLRRLGFGPDATEFFDEHVVADSVHELIALTDLVGPLVREGLGGQVLFGARCLAQLEAQASAHLLQRWRSGQTSLLPAVGLAAAD